MLEDCNHTAASANGAMQTNTAQPTPTELHSDATKQQPTMPAMSVLDTARDALNSLAALVATHALRGRWAETTALQSPTHAPETVVEPSSPSPHQLAGLEGQLRDMVVNLSKRLGSQKKPARTEAAEYKCQQCGEHFASRSQMFKHLRKLKHSIVRPTASIPIMRQILNGDAAGATATATARVPPGWASLKADATVLAPIDSGETAIQLAAIMYTLATAKASIPSAGYGRYARPDCWCELIAALLAAGADPFARPQINKACLDRFGRIKSETRQLQQWGADHHFRASAAELAWVTADPNLCALLLSKASAAMLTQISTVRFVACPDTRCENGGAVIGGFGGGGHALDGTEPASCCKCATTFCSACRREDGVHTTGSGSWSTCDEAFCTELVNQHHLTPKEITALRNIDSLDSTSTALKCVVDRMATIQVDSKASPATRGAAVDALSKFAPERVARCKICDDAFIESVPVLACRRGMLRVEKLVCDHQFCQSCYVGWIGANLEDRKTHINCPEPGCKVVLYSDDVERIAPATLHTLYRRLVTADYRIRLLETMREAGGNWAANDPQTRPCPACRVVIHRSAGCDDFICNCGHRFHFTNAKWPTASELQAEIKANAQAARRS